MIPKFRVWSNRDQKMYPVQLMRTNISGSITVNGSANIDEWNPIVISGNDKNGELLLYTGLNDATKWEQLNPTEQKAWLGSGKKMEEWVGREVCEGDIFDSPSGNKFIVVFKHGCFLQQHIFDDQPSFPISMVASQWIIVGNIYENPELLTKP